MTETPSPMSAAEIRALRGTMAGVAAPGEAVRPDRAQESADWERSRADRARSWAMAVQAMGPEELAEQPEALGASNFREARLMVLDRVRGATEAYLDLQADAAGRNGAEARGTAPTNDAPHTATEGSIVTKDGTVTEGGIVTEGGTAAEGGSAPGGRQAPEARPATGAKVDRKPRGIGSRG